MCMHFGGLNMKFWVQCDCQDYTGDVCGVDCMPWGYRFNIFDDFLVDAAYKCPECLHIVTVSLRLKELDVEECCGKVVCQCQL